MKVRVLSLCAVLMLSGQTAANAALLSIGVGDFSASQTVVTYTGVPGGPIAGRTIDGVTHNGVASIAPAPAIFSGLSGTVIEGPGSSVLSLVFSSVQAKVGFNWGISVQSNGRGGVVELFDAADQSLGSLEFTGAVVPGFPFREGFFGVSSSVPFLRADVTWEQPLANSRFAFDNLRYEGTVPEPGTLALLGLGIAGVAASRRRRR